MKKKLLLTSFAVLSSIGLANAVCTPPTTLKCACQHPTIENGLLVCGESYCGDKKCMPDGSCCESDKYCESSEQGKQCCSDGQTCDTTTGCVEAKADIETLCAKAGGSIYPLGSFTTCWPGDEIWHPDQGISWCLEHGMRMVTVYDFCPNWSGDIGSRPKSECPDYGNRFGELWTSTLCPNGYCSIEQRMTSADSMDGSERFYTNIYPSGITYTILCI